MTRAGFDRPSHTRDGRIVLYPVNKDVLPGVDDTCAGIGRRWANVANTPFRYWKAQTYEGGICTPLIVHWPAGLEVKPGSITQQPGHVIDLMATFVELARTSYPEEFEDRTITPLEGRSLIPILQGQMRDGHEALFWEHYGARAVRQGDWKLVSRAGERWELYNLAEDRTETRDRASEHPEKVETLLALYTRWMKRANIVPRPAMQ